MALENVSFFVDSGEFLCILGPSGCGKTTLLSLIAGTLKLQDGDITFDKHEYSKMSSILLDKFRADHIGYIKRMQSIVDILSNTKIVKFEKIN